MSVVVHRTITHLLNKEENNVILTDYENTLNQELNKIFEKTFKSTMKNTHLRKGVFNNYGNNTIQKCVEEILYNHDSFIENSKIIAQELFDIIMLDSEMESCSLAIGLFTVKDEKYVGIFKIDYKKSFASEIKMTTDNKFKINIVEKTNVIPPTMKSTQSAIIGVTGLNDEYHLQVLDVKAEKEHLDSAFIDKFLNVTKVYDDVYKTKVLKNTIENFISNCYVDNPKEGEDVRAMLTYLLKEKEEVNPTELINEIISDTAKKDALLEILKEKDLTDEIILDRKWLDKELKNRTFKTDTGVTIKATTEDLLDATKYSLRKNPDGSVDIVIKNVKHFG